MQYHHKKTNTICFDSFDLKQLFETEGKGRLIREIKKSGYSTEDLLIDESKIHEIVNTVKLVKDKEDVEIFIALYSLFRFYPKESKICFLLKREVDPKKEPIDTLEKLKNSLKENDLTDFGLMTDDGLRNFQLKQYIETVSADGLFNFIKEKLLHYGNNLGDTNLLIILRATKGDIRGSFFHDLHKKLKTLSIKGDGCILVLYNEENKFDVMNTVYPNLGTTRIPLRLPSNQ